jgi:hypothetical protein
MNVPCSSLPSILRTTFLDSGMTTPLTTTSINASLPLHAENVLQIVRTGRFIAPPHWVLDIERCGKAAAVPFLSQPSPITSELVPCQGP